VLRCGALDLCVVGGLGCVRCWGEGLLRGDTLVGNAE
jgi:hypothetical protein